MHNHCDGSYRSVDDILTWINQIWDLKWFIMLLQHSLPICLTFVRLTGILDLFPTKIWTWCITDKNALWVTSITGWECALGCKVCYSAFINILTNHLSKQYRRSALEVLVLAICRHNCQKVMCLHSSLALSVHRGISHTKVCCHSAHQCMYHCTQ